MTQSFLKPTIVSLALTLSCLLTARSHGQTRQWSDPAGNYTLEAELVMFNEKSVVLKRADHELVAIPLAELSDADREYLKSQPALDQQQQVDTLLPTLKLTDGTEIAGRIVDFAERDVTLRRWRGNFYVNDRRLDTSAQVLPAVASPSRGPLRNTSHRGPQRTRKLAGPPARSTPLIPLGRRTRGSRKRRRSCRAIFSAS